MKSAFRPLVFVLIIAAAMAGFATWRKYNEPKENIPWRATLAEAKREAAASQKPVLAYFTATWCPPCQRMKHDTWPDPRVQAALGRYVPVKIDVDEFPKLAEEFEVTGIPRLQVIHADGTRGRAHEGLILPDELIRWLQGE
jgi:protein disulfide-isomerase